ncbi:hypothetical protein [Paraflavitalea speifideaquila]|uniref:hypothetical protein n=1 Tax=Paraflavitalea speifideaquila TaxID=3076558 RepID=UPI0028EF7519|nr:hypothetical protein [Paraflavitalea speifideiaquila]
MDAGMILTGPGLKANYQEADWEKLYREIRKGFNTTYAKRNLLQARKHWYERNRNYHAFGKYSLQYLKEYPPDLTDHNQRAQLNSVAWNIFLHTTDKQLIDEAIQWMRKIFDQNPHPVEKGFASIMDTYANLLYKAGRTVEAIQWEEKAAALWPERELFKEVVRQMKRGEPTHGAVWGYH